jgi:hypothetical protein
MLALGPDAYRLLASCQLDQPERPLSMLMLDLARPSPSSVRAMPCAAQAAAPG